AGWHRELGRRPRGHRAGEVRVLRRAHRARRARRCGRDAGHAAGVDRRPDRAPGDHRAVPGRLGGRPAGRLRREARMNVLVDGASSGIGAATAIAFARRGATVGICARRGDRLEEVLAEVPGGKMWVVDLADLDGLDAFAATADEQLGGIDVLVNNAGVPKRRRTTTMTAEDVESVMAMNYFSP